MFSKKIESFVLSLAFTVFVTNIAAQTAGSLDPTFADAGTQLIITYGTGGTVQRDGVLQSDGKPVSLVDNSVSATTLVRLNIDGTPDTSFGGDGTIETNWHHPGGFPFGIAIQMVGGQERLVVAGSWKVPKGRGTVDGLRVDRYLPDGSIDTSFGGGGTVFIETGYALAVAIQPQDQKIVTVGDLGVLVRLNANGSIDNTFGKAGKVSIAEKDCRAIKALSNGKILVGGSGYKVGSATGMGVTRFNSNGTVDTAFGTNGKAVATFFGNNSFARAFGIDIDPYGNIVLGGFARPGGASIMDNDFAAARFTSTGQLDQSLNGTGKVNYDLGGVNSHPRSVAVQFDGRIVLGGSAASPSGDQDYFLVRYNYDGSPDTTFGTNGVSTTNIDGSDYSFTLRIQNDPYCACEKLVMMGSSHTGASFARFMTW